MINRGVEEINRGVEMINRGIGEINRGVEEINRGVEEINRRVKRSIEGSRRSIGGSKDQSKGRGDQSKGQKVNRGVETHQSNVKTINRPTHNGQSIPPIGSIGAFGASSRCSKETWEVPPASSVRAKSK